MGLFTLLKINIQIKLCRHIYFTNAITSNYHKLIKAFVAFVAFLLKNLFLYGHLNGELNLRRVYIIRYSSLLLFLIAFSFNVYSNSYNYSPDSRVHNFFNPTILKPLEQKLTLYGNYSIGISKNLEIGSSVLYLLGGMPNFSLKHKMFDFKNTKTSFISRNSFINSGESLSSKSTMLYLLNGIVTSFDFGGINQNKSINFGATYNYIKINSNNNESDKSINSISSFIGYDHYISNELVFSSLIKASMWQSLNIEDESVQINISNFSLSNQGKNDLSKLSAFASSTLTQSFNWGELEGGVMYIPALSSNDNSSSGEGNSWVGVIPYVNMIWRWL